MTSAAATSPFCSTRRLSGEWQRWLFRALESSRSETCKNEKSELERSPDICSPWTPPQGESQASFLWLFWVAFVKQKEFISGNLVGHISPWPAYYFWGSCSPAYISKKSEKIRFVTALTFLSCSLASRHSCICSFSSSISFLAASSFSTARLLLASKSDCSWCICSKTASCSEDGDTCLGSVCSIRGGL